MRQPTFAVFGATGRQDGSIARAVLARGDWRVRAITRRPYAAPAAAQARLGADLHRADPTEAASLAGALQDFRARLRMHVGELAC